jgi:hypothetical protein
VDCTVCLTSALIIAQSGLVVWAGGHWEKKPQLRSSLTQRPLYSSCTVAVRCTLSMMGWVSDGTRWEWEREREREWEYGDFRLQLQAPVVGTEGLGMRQVLRMSPTTALLGHPPPTSNVQPPTSSLQPPASSLAHRRQQPDAHRFPLGRCAPRRLRKMLLSRRWPSPPPLRVGLRTRRHRTRRLQ